MREAKTLLLDEITGQMDRFDSFVVMSYEKLTANAANDFRAGISNLGGSVEMVSKRMLLQAAKKKGVKIDRGQLPGHISLVFSGPEFFETAKTVIKYSKDNSDAFTVLLGQFEGKTYTGADVHKLASLPTLDVMRAQFVGLLEAPMVETVMTMESILSSIVTCLENKAKKDGENASS